MRKRPRNLVGLLQQTGGKLGERAAEFSVPALLAATAHERSPRAGSPGAEAPSALDPSKTLPAGFSVSIAFGVDRSVLTVRCEVQVEPPPPRIMRAWPPWPQLVDAAGPGPPAGRPR